ncbi:DUF1656 domain-containing protein [Gluconacetobacter azotocaptans]|uniref:DUF1656 domain-containing protein n=1 Tax=Gluconacetobacter azotocaptans TaxID=142834 RepID=A0A7W4JSQ1_9PROT|nr:DUF1656 domain-containing protein [Gluconacetobacter azotocaptans]MBB2190180.1 DUF1656 domain-containing protein [Gluconacetobacter azotocaptans]MBM9403668.1 DUF1656 domain-containing protein [Gluconacetobacter azotocaptans]GBQ28779.1 hypothetical protein AA13594_1121 [Gluconacetobacter azotocaptans DSM 13594]
MVQVIDIDGVLISSFVANGALALLTLILLRPLLGRVGIQRLVWNMPLAEFGLLICLLGIYTLLL